MGVKNLWDILESCKQTLPLHHLQNKRLCVDLSCWLVQLQNANKSHNCVKEKLYLRSLFHRVRALMALNCSLIFVTDGSIPSIKLATYRRRLGSALEVIQDDPNAQTVQPLRRNMGSEFSCMIKEAKVLALALGIACLDGLEEAEAQCASLNSATLCDGCFTSDSDIFLFGARTVYRDIFLGEGGHITCYEMVDIERKLGFGRNSLITLALLLGSDYSQGVHGFGPETACQIVKSIGDDTVLHRIVAEGLAFVRKTKGKKKTEKVLGRDMTKENDQSYKQSTSDNNGKKPAPDDQFQHVINAYLNPKCHLPDSEAVQRVCTRHPFLRMQLQQICAHSFGWSPDQTDQYILPKVAERDLRRFANLRTISSEFGVRTALNEIPVPCPVSAIIKQRKVQGKECFEVSWNEVDGLQSSIVPADLVESACPEKIAEFMEKKDEGRKQNRRPRPRKPARAAVTEVDLQLQGLLLSIESESNALNTSKPCHPTGITESQSNAINTSKPRHSTGITESQSNPFLDTNKCIDLSSESQHINNCIDLSSESQHINNCIDLSSESQLINKCIDLSSESQHTSKCIDLSSEPQHIGISTESHTNSVLDSSIYHYPGVRGNIEFELIDLSSPSPPLRACKVAKCQTAPSQHLDLINVSESETDTSPEHEKKARELRLFIDSIRTDLN